MDAVWLGLLMARSYDRGLGALARRAADGSLSPSWPSAAVVYALLATGILLLVRPLVTGMGIGHAFLYGAIFGAVVYGVYDFTNHATLKDWPLWLSFVDMAWGAFLLGCASAAMKLVERVSS